MGLDGVSPAALVFPLLNFTFGTIQTGFELGSAPAETTSLLKTIDQVSTELKSAYKIRETISQKVDINDLTRIDDAIRNTEDAVYDVQALGERARVDISTRFGKVGTRSKILWVVRDSKKVPTALMRLAIANTCLKSSLDEASRHQISSGYKSHTFGNEGNWKNADDAFRGVAPPPYEEATKASMFERRRFKDRRNAIHRSASLPSRENASSWTIPHGDSIYSSVFPVTTALAHLDDLRGYVQNNELMLQSAGATSPLGQSEQIVMVSLDDSANVRCDLQPCFELETISATTPTKTTKSTSTYQSYTQTAPASSVFGPLPPFTETYTPWHEPLAQKAPPTKSTPHVPHSQTTSSLTSPPKIPPSVPPKQKLLKRPVPPYPHNTPLLPAQSPLLPPQGPPARLPSILQPGPRPYNLSGQTISDSRLDLGQPLPKRSKPPREPPSAWHAKDTLKTRKSPLTSSSSMESEAWIPGQKKPMQIRWQEPEKDGDKEDDEDDDETHPLVGGVKTSSNNIHAFPDRELGNETVAERQSLSSSDSYANITTPPPTEQVLTSSRRRRPARFASGVTDIHGPATPEPSAVAGPPSVTSSRRGLTSMRKSRSEWLVEQGTGSSSLL